jgi:hypothetical protein
MAAGRAHDRSQPYAQSCRQTGKWRHASSRRLEKIDLRLWWLSSFTGAAMNRFVHRLIMSVLLAAALVLIWNVLGSR